MRLCDQGWHQAQILLLTVKKRVICARLVQLAKFRGDLSIMFGVFNLIFVWSFCSEAD